MKNEANDGAVEELMGTRSSRAEKLKLLLEEAAKQPGISDLLYLQQQDWYRAAVVQQQPVAEIRHTSASADSLTTSSEILRSPNADLG